MALLTNGDRPGGAILARLCPAMMVLPRRGMTSIWCPEVTARSFSRQSRRRMRAARLPTRASAANKPTWAGGKA
jgi:hypothetical protein